MDLSMANNYKKIKKLLTQPGIFFRDFLNKKYPIRNIEQPFSESLESILIKSNRLLYDLVAINVATTFPIDVVFTWVNDSDELWQKKYQTFVPLYMKDAALYATDPARFSNHNELYYSVNAVIKFMPWVNHIYIVTDNQKPAWLNECNKVTIVDHKDIIDSEYLPTFNSHVIEAFLHKIPNLSENFIYFNDDVFVARPLQPEHFFQNNGVASLFVAAKSLRKMRENGTITPTLSASERSITLLNRYYQTNLDTPLVHTYIPLKKSAYQLAWQRYEKDIKTFLSNKFRHNGDLDLANFLIPWLMYFEEKAVPQLEICYYFNIRSPDALAKYRKLIHKKQIGQEPHSFCANDFHCNINVPNYQEALLNMLDEYYK